MRTWSPAIGGSITFALTLLALVTSFLAYPDSPEDTRPFIPNEFSYSLVKTLLTICIVLSPIGLVGGITAIMRRYYLLANAGCVASLVVATILFYLFGLFAALIAWSFIAISKEEFLRTSPRSIVPLTDEPSMPD